MRKQIFLTAGAAVVLTLVSVLPAAAGSRTEIVLAEMDRLDSGSGQAKDLGWESWDEPAVPAAGVTDRDRRIDQALTRAASGGIKTKNFCWEDVCALPSSQPSSSRTFLSAPASSGRDSFYDRFLNLRRPENSLEIGVEWFDYTYREEAFMKLDGTMQGLYADYRHHFKENQPVETWRDVWGAPNNFNVLMLQTRYSYGDDIKYRSSGTGEAYDEEHYVWESRILLGYDVPLRNRMITVTPYFGLGYRYLLDDNGGKQTTSEAWSYDRESHYFYLPLGMDVTRQFENQWSLGLNLEYDFFITGTQKTHFEDVPGYSETLTNKQDSGYGMRGSVKAVKEFNAVDFVMEPFARYWHIQDSDVSCTVDTCGLEPKNRTWEFGIRAGVRF